MSDTPRREAIHELDATLRVGKRGIDPVVDELDDQLADSTFVKVKFLRAARGGTTTDDLGAELADRVGADLVRTRGHTAVFER